MRIEASEGRTSARERRSAYRAAPIRRKRRILRAALWLAPVMVLACDDSRVAGPGAADDALQRLPPGIHPVLFVPPGAGAVHEIRLHLYGVETDASVASYQGEITYDAEALEIVGATFDEGVMGAWNVTRPGHLRIAGISLDGISGTPAVTLKVRSSRIPVAADFHVKLEELRGSGDFIDLTGRVVERDHPVLTRTDPGVRR